MCCFTSWNVLSGVCEGFSPNAAIYFCALNVTRRRENEASIPKRGWGGHWLTQTLRSVLFVGGRTAQLQR